MLPEPAVSAVIFPPGWAVAEDGETEDGATFSIGFAFFNRASALAPRACKSCSAWASAIKKGEASRNRGAAKTLAMPASRQSVVDGMVFFQIVELGLPTGLEIAYEEYLKLHTFNHDHIFTSSAVTS
jgi:hypothetical protein